MVLDRQLGVLNTCSGFQPLPARCSGCLRRNWGWWIRLRRESRLNDTTHSDPNRTSGSFPHGALKAPGTCGVEQVRPLQQVPVPAEGLPVVSVQEGLVQQAVLHHLQPLAVVVAELRRLDLLCPLLVVFLRRDEAGQTAADELRGIMGRTTALRKLNYQDPF